MYGECGLASEAVAVWLDDSTLTIAFADEVLAQYRVTYQPDQRHLANVDEPRLFTTPHRSPQPYRWHLGDGEWLRVPRCPAYAPRRRRAALAVQPPLFA